MNRERFAGVDVGDSREFAKAFRRNAGGGNARLLTDGEKAILRAVNESEGARGLLIAEHVGAFVALGSDEASAQRQGERLVHGDLTADRLRTIHAAIRIANNRDCDLDQS